MAGRERRCCRRRVGAVAACARGGQRGSRGAAARSRVILAGSLKFGSSKHDQRRRRCRSTFTRSPLLTVVHMEATETLASATIRPDSCVTSQSKCNAGAAAVQAVRKRQRCCSAGRRRTLSSLTQLRFIHCGAKRERRVSVDWKR